MQSDGAKFARIIWTLTGKAKPMQIKLPANATPYPLLVGFALVVSMYFNPSHSTLHGAVIIVFMALITMTNAWSNFWIKLSAILTAANLLWPIVLGLM